MSRDELERIRNSIQVHLAQMKDRQDSYRENKNGAAANAVTTEMQAFTAWARWFNLSTHPLDVNLDSGVGKPLSPKNRG